MEDVTAFYFVVDKQAETACVLETDGQTCIALVERLLSEYTGKPRDNFRVIFGASLYKKYAKCGMKNAAEVCGLSKIKNGEAVK